MAKSKTNADDLQTLVNETARDLRNALVDIGSAGQAKINPIIARLEGASNLSAGTDDAPSSGDHSKGVVAAQPLATPTANAPIIPAQPVAPNVNPAPVNAPVTNKVVAPTTAPVTAKATATNTATESKSGSEKK